MYIYISDIISMYICINIYICIFMYVHVWMFTILSDNSKVSVLIGFLRAFQLIPDQMWTICFGCRGHFWVTTDVKRKRHAGAPGRKQ